MSLGRGEPSPVPVLRKPRLGTLPQAPRQGQDSAGTATLTSNPLLYRGDGAAGRPRPPSPRGGTADTRPACAHLMEARGNHPKVLHTRPDPRHQQRWCPLILWSSDTGSKHEASVSDKECGQTDRHRGGANGPGKAPVFLPGREQGAAPADSSGGAQRVRTAGLLPPTQARPRAQGPSRFT